MADFCFDPNSELIPLDEVRTIIDAHLKPTSVTETLALSAVQGFVCASDIIAARNIPQHNNSGLDGYALNGIDTHDTFKIIGRIGAGDASITLQSGEAVHINTGAIVPDAAEAVVAFEECEVDGELVRPIKAAREGGGIRPAGEDLRQGEIAIARGERLDASSIALIAACGFDSVSVFKPLRVAVVSSGSELIEAGAPHGSGNIYDANRPFLLSTLNKFHYKVVDGGVIADDYAILKNHLTELANTCDCIITSAGASASDADFASRLLDEHFDMVLWRIALRPGRPFGFGFIGTTPIFVLPGNPIAVISTWSMLVKSALERLQGANEQPLVPTSMILGEAFSKKQGRTELYRVRIDADGRLYRSGAQGSGILSGVHKGDGFVVLNHDDGAKAAGDRVNFYPKSAFF